MKKCMGCMRDYGEEYNQCPACGYSQEQADADKKRMPEILPAGTILSGRYILGRVLSNTDYSIIYMAWDALLLKRVAVREYFPVGLGRRSKRTNKISVQNSEKKKMFLYGLHAFEKEMILLHKMQDITGIVEVYRCIRENNTTYAVMEYLQGCTLQDRLDQEKRISPGEAGQIFRGLAGVLENLHARGICHGNLSPDSIYLEDTGRMRLIDFGGAKLQAYRKIGAEMEIFQTAYLAPEVMKGQAPEKNADLYSLGMIYARMLSGKEPKEGRPRLKSGNMDLEAQKLIQYLTAAKAEQRPENVMQLRAWMERENG